MAHDQVAPTRWVVMGRALACFAAASALWVGCEPNADDGQNGTPDGGPSSGGSTAGSGGSSNPEGGMIDSGEGGTAGARPDGQGGASSGGAAGDTSFGGGDSGGSGGGLVSEAGADAQVSVRCGDSIRDPMLEECDDGPGDGHDACTATCRVHNYFVVEPLSSDAGARDGSRSLGFGRHPAASDSDGSIVTFVEERGSGVALRAALFNAAGARRGSAFDVGVGLSPAEASEPAAAALPVGGYVVAWADLAKGSLDIALRTVSASGVIGAPRLANQTTIGAQQDPDILWAENQVVVAWVDNFIPFYRRFNADLSPIDDEIALAPSDSFGGSASLSKYGASWAIAWRALQADGGERIRVRSGPLDWTVGPFPPGPWRERPAVAELDDSHLLVAFSQGTESGGSGTITRLRGAVLSSLAPGTVLSFAIENTIEPWMSDMTLSESRPGLSRIGTRIYLTWQSESPLGDPLGDEVWLRELTWNGAELGLLEPMKLQADAPRLDNQRAPVIVASQAGLVTLWEDSTRDPRHEILPDIVFGLRPIPFLDLETMGGQ